MTNTIVTITRANTSELYRSLVVNLAVSGTATFGTDYIVLGATSFNATTASITIPANQTSQTITLSSVADTVSSVADTVFEPDETVILTVVPTAGVSSGSGSVTWTILNDDSLNYVGLNYVSDGDTNGLIYYLGTDQRTTVFSNPSLDGRLSILESSILYGYNTPAIYLTDRNSESILHTNNIPNQWFALTIPNRLISVDKYTIRCRGENTVSHSPRNWVLEGANTISTFNIAGVNAATWTAIDTRINDSTLTTSRQFYTLTINGSNSSFKYLRFRQTGLTNLGTNFLVLGEIEFYGVLT